MSDSLNGLRVLELAEGIAGPYCGMLLGDFGADVVKLENEQFGDGSRRWGLGSQQFDSEYFLALNRNKRSVSLNLESDQGRDIFVELLKKADVLIHTKSEGGAIAIPGIDFNLLHSLNKGLVNCSITGYGLTGPKSGQSTSDLLIQAESGLMSFTGDRDDEPMPFPVPIAEITAGLYACLGIFGALRLRDKTGLGQSIDTAMFDSQLTWLSHVASNYLNAGEEPERIGNSHASIVPYQVFRAQDKYIIVCVATEDLWRRFCKILEIEDTIGLDERFSSNRSRNVHRAVLIPLLQTILESKPAARWIEMFQSSQIPSGPIETLAEALDNAQVQARGMIAQIEHPLLGAVQVIGNPIRLSQTPVVYLRPPPLLGEHSDEILRELGKTEDQIEELKKQFIVRAK